MTTANPDDVAKDQLQAFVDLRTPDAPVERMKFVMRHLRPFARDRGYVFDRAFTAGGRLTGYSHRELRNVLSLSSRFADIDVWFERRAWLLPIRLKAMPDRIPADLQGEVYTARLPEYPHVIKVGISTDLDRRMRELTRTTGCKHEVEAHFSGCYFDEALQMIGRARHNLWSEWFVDPDKPLLDLPEFLARGHSQDLWRSAVKIVQGIAPAPAGLNTPNALLSVYAQMLRGEVRA